MKVLIPIPMIVTLIKNHLDGTNRSSPHSFSTALMATWQVLKGDDKPRIHYTLGLAILANMAIELSLLPESP